MTFVRKSGKKAAVWVNNEYIIVFETYKTALSNAGIDVEKKQQKRPK